MAKYECDDCGKLTELVDLNDCDGIELCATCARDAGYFMCALCGIWTNVGNDYVCLDCEDCDE